jgi:hypothetical protein
MFKKDHTFLTVNTENIFFPIPDTIMYLDQRNVCRIQMCSGALSLLILLIRSKYWYVFAIVLRGAKSSFSSANAYSQKEKKTLEFFTPILHTWSWSWDSCFICDVS